LALAYAKLLRMTMGIERPEQAEISVQPPKFTGPQLELIQGFVDGNSKSYDYESLPDDLVVAMEEKSKRLAAIKAIKLAVRFNFVTTERLHPPKESLNDVQLTILACTYRGLSMAQTAEELRISNGHTAYLRSSTFKIIGVNNFLQATGWIEKYSRNNG